MNIKLTELMKLNENGTFIWSNFQEKSLRACLIFQWNQVLTNMLNWKGDNMWKKIKYCAFKFNTLILVKNDISIFFLTRKVFIRMFNVKRIIIQKIIVKCISNRFNHFQSCQEEPKKICLYPVKLIKFLSFFNVVYWNFFWVRLLSITLISLTKARKAKDECAQNRIYKLPHEPQ